MRRGGGGVGKQDVQVGEELRRTKETNREATSSDSQGRAVHGTTACVTDMLLSTHGAVDVVFRRQSSPAYPRMSMLAGSASSGTTPVSEASGYNQSCAFSTRTSTSSCARTVNCPAHGTRARECGRYVEVADWARTRGFASTSYPAAACDGREPA